MWPRRTPNSTWTVDTLLEYWKDRHVDLQLQMEQRFEAQEKLMEIHRTAIEAASAASDKAVSKAEDAIEKRFDAVNEFRASLSDQAALFITRKETEAAIERNSERIREIGDRLQDFPTKAIVLAEYDRLSSQTQNLAERITRSEGKGHGLATGWGYIVAAASAVAMVVAAYVAIRNG